MRVKADAIILMRMNGDSQVNIRLLQPTDTEAIAFLKHRFIWWLIVTDEEMERDYFQPAFAGGFPYIFLAFTLAGELAGNIFLNFEKEGYLGIKNVPWVEGLFVKDEFRKHGIGRALMATVEDKCRELGDRKLYLDSSEAAAYYEKLGGWKRLGTVSWEKKS